jgi:hypothetical protein
MWHFRGFSTDFAGFPHTFPLFHPNASHLASRSLKSFLLVDWTDQITGDGSFCGANQITSLVLLAAFSDKFLHLSQGIRFPLV